MLGCTMRRWIVFVVGLQLSIHQFCTIVALYHHHKVHWSYVDHQEVLFYFIYILLNVDDEEQTAIW